MCACVQIDIIVAGVIYKESKQGGEGGDDQGRKYLLLFEEKSEKFFMGKWTKYRRVPVNAGTANFDANDSSSVKKLESCNRIHDLIPVDPDLGKLKTCAMLKKRSEEPPPAIRLHRMKAQALAKANQREAIKRAKMGEARRQKERDDQAYLAAEWRKANASATEKQQDLERLHQAKMDAMNQEIELVKAASMKAIEEARQRAHHATASDAPDGKQNQPPQKPDAPATQNSMFCCLTVGERNVIRPGGCTNTANI